MNKDLKIEGVMTPFPHSIGLDQSLTVARQMMREHGVRHLPVQDGGRLSGVISNRDINFVLNFEKADADTLKVSDAYTEEPYEVEPDATVASVARRMAADRIGCALVAKEGRLLGIFTTVDACRVLSGILHGDL